MVHLLGDGKDLYAAVTSGLRSAEIDLEDISNKNYNMLKAIGALRKPYIFMTVPTIGQGIGGLVPDSTQAYFFDEDAGFLICVSDDAKTKTGREGRDYVSAQLVHDQNYIPTMLIIAGEDRDLACLTLLLWAFKVQLIPNDTSELLHDEEKINELASRVLNLYKQEFRAKE